MTGDRFQTAMRELPLIAILRGLKPTKAAAIVSSFRSIERGKR
jgi:hypothetical protein